MLVNAFSFPGPALWQGVMLLALCPWAMFIFRKAPIKPAPGYYRKRHKANLVATIWFVNFGLVLAAAILQFQR